MTVARHSVPRSSWGRRTLRFSQKHSLPPASKRLAIHPATEGVQDSSGIWQRGKRGEGFGAGRVGEDGISTAWWLVKMAGCLGRTCFVPGLLILSNALSNLVALGGIAH
jgi:hypothetical protein